MAANAVATVLGGFWEQYGSVLTQAGGEGTLRRKAAQRLNHLGVYDLRERMRALNGVAPGGLASKTFPRVLAAVELGGVRAIEQLSLINRVTTAADVTEINATINTFSTTTTFGATPPANLDGNPLGTR